MHSSPQASGSALGGGPSAFKAPAHKHAHHLHSIPPREKSTRTLILDHMLWVHARTRLQQARAELGMTITGQGDDGDGANVDGELGEQDLPSDGEDVMMLKFGAKERQRDLRLPEEDDHLTTQNLALAQALRLRGDGVEKVLTAMLDQPPEVQPPYSDEDTPRTPPAIHGVGEHHFPNGVRLRLALSTLVNDLFARDVPTPLSPTSSNTPSTKPRITSTPSTSPVLSTLSKPNQPPTPYMSLYDRDGEDETMENRLPLSIAPLAAISSYTRRTSRDDLTPGASRVTEGNGGGTTLPSFSSFTRSSSNPTTDILPPILSLSPADSIGIQVRFSYKTVFFVLFLRLLLLNALESLKSLMASSPAYVLLQ